MECVQAGWQTGDFLPGRHVLHADTALLHRAAAVARLLREHRHLCRGKTFGAVEAAVVFVYGRDGKVADTGKARDVNIT